jgi:hypothetical protein
MLTLKKNLTSIALKGFTVFFISFFCSINGFSQLNVSTGVVGVYPFGDQSSVLDYGVGGNLSVGYQLKSITLGLDYNTLLFSSIYKSYKIMNESIFLDYTPFKRVGFYVGFGGIFAQRAYTLTAIPSKTKNKAFGYKVILGTLTPIFKSEKLYLKSSLQFNQLFFENKLNSLQMNLGLLYKFNS